MLATLNQAHIVALAIVKHIGDTCGNISGIVYNETICFTHRSNISQTSVKVQIVRFSVN